MDKSRAWNRIPGHSILGLAVLLLMVACSSNTPAPVEDREVTKRVRAPASEESAGVQVYSLQNPAVKQLTAQAEGAERSGDLDLATGYIERALRIQPQDPQLLQHMAELKLQKEDYQQALNFAREHLRDSNGASEAEARATQCMNTRPKGY